MPHITLTDNNFHNPPKLLDVAKETDSAIQAYEDLQLVANKSLKDLCKNQSLLVFPQCLGEHDDYLCGIYENICSKDNNKTEIPKKSMDEFEKDKIIIANNFNNFMKID